MMVESITQSRPRIKPRRTKMATKVQKVRKYTPMPRLSRRRLSWLELITSPGVKPQARARIGHCLIRRTIISGDSCHTLMTMIVTKMLSSLYVIGCPPGSAGKAGLSQRFRITMNQARANNCSSLTIWGEKIKGSSLPIAVMARCWRSASSIVNIRFAPLCWDCVYECHNFTHT